MSDLARCIRYLLLLENLLFNCAFFHVYLYVEAERDFSKMKLIKNRLRNRLNKNLNNLMNVSLNGPKLQDFDFETAAKKFALSKARRAN